MIEDRAERVLRVVPRRRVLDGLPLYRSLAEQVTGEARDPEVPDGVPVSYAVAGAVDLAVEPKQELLELRDEDERLKRLRSILQAAAAGMDRAKVAAERAQGNGKVSSP